jgi:hypothetical protein
MQTPAKIGISVEKQGTSIDRKVSVAPMMDWTDEGKTALGNSSL